MATSIRDSGGLYDSCTSLAPQGPSVPALQDTALAHEGQLTVGLRPFPQNEVSRAPRGSTLGIGPAQPNPAVTWEQAVSQDGSVLGPVLPWPCPLLLQSGKRGYTLSQTPCLPSSQCLTSTQRALERNPQTLWYGAQDT